MTWDSIYTKGKLQYCCHKIVKYIRCTKEIITVLFLVVYTNLTLFSIYLFICTKEIKGLNYENNKIKHDGIKWIILQ